MFPSRMIPASTRRRILSLAALLVSLITLATLAPPCLALPQPSDYAEPGKSVVPALQKIQKLDHPTTLSGYLCKGYYRLWTDGSLNQARLAAPAQIQGLTLPAETTIWLFPGGKRIRRMWPGRDMTIQNIPCNNANDVVFHPNGRLAAAFLSAPAIIQGLPLKKSGLCPVYFHENGKLKEATLGKEAEIAGKKYPANLTLHFDENGNIIKTEPAPSLWRSVLGIFSRPKKTNEK